MSNALRAPVEQLVSLLVPSFAGRGRPRVIRDPFLTVAPGFFTYLREERGVRETSVRHYRHYLRFFEAYLNRIGVQRLAELSPAILSAFVTEAGQGRSKSAMKGMCSAVRVLVRYAYRERVIGRDLSGAIELPRTYRSASVPRSITWDEVRLMLESVDRRGAVGKRNASRATVPSTRQYSVAASNSVTVPCTLVVTKSMGLSMERSTWDSAARWITASGRVCEKIRRTASPSRMSDFSKVWFGASIAVPSDSTRPA